MNTNTGEIRDALHITDEEWQSGEWVPVSDQVARIVKTGTNVHDRRRKRKATKAARRKNRK
jgi:hypothetical protein